MEDRTENKETENKESEDKKVEKEAKLRIGGMHCASCVNTVSHALKNVRGVEDVDVNLATSSAKVIMSSDVRLKDVVRAVKKAGYDVITSRGTIRVNVLPEDMSKVRALVESMDGVVQVLDNPGLGTLNVEFNPEETSIQGITQALSLSGYRATVMESGKEEDVLKKDFRERLIRLLVGVAVLPAVLLTHGVVQLVLSIPVQFYSGLTFHKGFLRALENKNANMDTLVSLSSNILWFSSVYFLFMGKQTFFDVASMLITFVLVGKTLEAYLKYRISSQVKVPEIKAVAKDGRTVNARELKEGDIVVVKSGETIPADGVLEDGKGVVDESLMTGESEPVFKVKGDRLIAGSILVSGYLEEYVTTPFERSYINTVVETLREAYNAKVSIQRTVDKVSSWFTPFILLISGITFGIWFRLTGDVVASMLFAVSVLAAACPCALGLATPMAILAKVNRAMRRGIIIRNGSALEELNKVRVIVLDKTGTLTTGNYKISYFKEYVPNAMEMASALEGRSSHPIAKAFPKSSMRVESFDEFVGNGIYGRVGGHDVIVGKPSFVRQNCDVVEGVEGDLFVCVDGKIGATVSLKEELRDGAVESIEALKRRGFKIVIATGDSSKSADEIGKLLGVEVHKSLSPEEKGDLARDALFVGDGVNDAYAMREAKVGVAVSTGSDIAKSAGDLVIRDISQLPDVIKLGKSTEGKVKQNLGWAFGYNAAMLPLASGVLYPIWLSPEYSALAMSFSSVIVSLWSLI
ncbi:heavy metal translocating P-type ATPase [Sulfuracidifex tepidarius]|uniref:Copper-exporting P-type ATPase A n=1 Tax=Sulfuracidifex tepidarius TaxID=1294262 RepID=A0A510E0X6_9CREN|nr:cation-translocating P-type ATPase [Sulfuracidifex tepidarius]BBG25758.1 putative copper-exporting P-type ATPase A [Sulfuracidifex tepidarius]